MSVTGLNAIIATSVQIFINDDTVSRTSSVGSDERLKTSVTCSLVIDPADFGNFRFIHWTNNCYPTTSYRYTWDCAFNPISFILLESTTATDHYLSETRDTDNDGVPDWYKMKYFGDISRATSFDVDGNGMQLSAEYSGGSHLLYSNISQEKGISYADSGVVALICVCYLTISFFDDGSGACGLALQGDGSVAGWGCDHFLHEDVPAGLSNIANIVLGGLKSRALKSDGQVVAQGPNWYGESVLRSLHEIPFAAGSSTFLILNSSN